MRLINKVLYKTIGKHRCTYDNCTYRYPDGGIPKACWRGNPQCIKGEISLALDMIRIPAVYGFKRPQIQPKK